MSMSLIMKDKQKTKWGWLTYLGSETIVQRNKLIQMVSFIAVDFFESK